MSTGCARISQSRPVETRNSFRHRIPVGNPDQRQREIPGERARRSDERRRPVQTRSGENLLPRHLVREQVRPRRLARRQDVDPQSPPGSAVHRWPYHGK